MEKRMKRYKRLLTIIVVLTCFSAALGLQTDKNLKKAAQKVAEAWLPLLDDQKYEESWEALSQKTKKDLSKRQWEVGMMGFRKPLGKLKSRKLGKVIYIKSLQGYPDHQGAIVRFDSVYENRESV